MAYWLRYVLASLVTIALAIVMSSCGGESSAPASPTSPTLPAPVDPPIVTIAATGVNPLQLIVAVGDRVTFINNDSQPHEIAGGPDPATPDCREIDAVGFLAPGQSRQTAPLPVARTCDYHDHNNHSRVFTGRLLIR